MIAQCPARYRKRVAGGAPGYARWEAAGLGWLAQAEPDGGARVVAVHSVDEEGLVLDRLDSAPPSESAARSFGAALARTHQAGAPTWGAPPQGWDGPGWLGPAARPLPLELGTFDRWGSMYAARLRSLHERACAAGQFTTPHGDEVGALIDRIEAGDFDDDESPARLHGDLWSGNLMWTEAGVVLIDPAAHGGHREADLAMLALFGAPHLEVIHAAYDSVFPRTPGWRDRVALHQLHPLLVHVVLFGGGYASHTMSAVRLINGD